MKRSVIYVLAYITLCAVAVGPLKLYPSTAERESKPEQHKDSSKTAAPVVHQEHPLDEKPYGGQSATEGQAKPIKVTELPPEDAWYKAYVFATWLLVLIGAFGILYAVKTLKVMDQQAKLSTKTLGAIKRQADLQQAAMQQWVTIGKWVVDYAVNTLDIKMDIHNPTKLPLTVLTTKVRIGENECLRPHGIQVSGYTPFRAEVFTYDLSAKEVDEFMRGGILFVVTGVVVYRDCFGDTKEDFFSGLLNCRRESASFEPIALKNPFMKAHESKE
jgi:hypothetical protein